MNDLIENKNINKENTFKNLVDNYFNREDLLTENIDDISYKFLNALIENYIPKESFPEYEFDIIIGGGGLKGYYVFGAMEIIKKMINANLIKIRNFVGTSIGAIIAVYTICDISLHKIRNVYEFARYNSSKKDLNKILLKILNKYLPEDIHLKCNGRVKIVLSELTFLGFKEKIFDKYESREHLLKILSATTYIPYITSNSIKGVNINGKIYYDGGFVKNTPIIKNNNLTQLVFKTESVKYSTSNIFKLKDKCPEILIIKGAIEMEKFILELKENKSTNSAIKWYPKKNLEDNLLNKKIKNKNLNNKIKYITCIITIVLVILSKITKKNDKINI